MTQRAEPRCPLSKHLKPGRSAVQSGVLQLQGTLLSCARASGSNRPNFVSKQLRSQWRTRQEFRIKNGYAHLLSSSRGPDSV